MAPPTWRIAHGV